MRGLWAFAILFALGAFAHAQPLTVYRTSSIPSGTCTTQNGVRVINASGAIYTCGGSTWTNASGATIAHTTNTIRGDGSGNGVAVTGTATDCVLVNGTSGACGSSGVTSVGTSSPLTGGPITTTGTISCPTCTLTTRNINTTSPITGGGDLSADRTIACSTCLVNGGALGTPLSGTLTNATGLPIAGITGLGTGVGTALAANVSGSGAICLASGSACAGGGGSFVLVEQHTASSSSTLDFTPFTSTYDDYECRITNLILATSTDNLLMLVGTGAGPTWASANYRWAKWNSDTSTATGAIGSASDSSINLANSLGNASTGSLRANIDISDPQNATTWKAFTYQEIQISSSGTMTQGTGGAVYAAATALTGLRFKGSSGAITSGTIRCYGLAK